MRFPVDSGALRFRVASPAREDTDYETGKVKTRDGAPLWLLQVTAMDGAEVEVIRIRTTADVSGLRQDDEISVSGLSVLHWSMGERSGMSFAADKVASVTAGKAAAATGGGGAAGATSGSAK